MVDGVTDHVHERIGYHLDHVPVDFRFLAVGQQLHWLVGTLCDVAGEPLQLLEELAQRHHAQRHAQALQLAHDLAGLLHLACERAMPFALDGRIFDDHGMGDDQLADQVEHLVQPFRAHAHPALRPDGLRAGPALRRGRRDRGCGRFSAHRFFNRVLRRRCQLPQQRRIAGRCVGLLAGAECLNLL
jgi:hypothetical protein